jgi:hypothetical protein
MRNACFAFGLFAALVACGRSRSATRDAEVVAAGDAPMFADTAIPDGPGSSGGTGGTLLGTGGAGGIATTGETGGSVGSGGLGGSGGSGAGGAVATGGFNGSGGATGTGGGTIVNCGVQTLRTSRAAPEVLLVLDRSGSMEFDIARDCYCPGSSNRPICPNDQCKDRWSTLSSVVSATVASRPDVLWGLKLFYTPGGTGGTSGSPLCRVSKQVEVPIAADSGAAIQSTIQGTTPEGNTPTRMAILAATAYLKTVTDQNSKFILLATDGEPNCANGDATAQDVDGTRNAIAEAKAAGFPVYVIGIGPSAGNLSEFAAAGGTGQYYPATSPDELTSAFAAISTRVATCILNLSATPPDANNVAVYFDKSLVAKNDVNGWSFASNQQVVQLNGIACEELKLSTAMTVTVLFGCPGMPLPPMLP